jgi:hypothetical protein
MVARFVIFLLLVLWLVGVVDGLMAKKVGD